MRFTVMVKHRVSMTDIVDAFCVRSGFYGEPFPKTRRDAIKLVKGALRKSGMALQDDASECHSYRPKAQKIAEQLFPEMKRK